MTDEIFSETLHVDPKEHPILFSESSLHNKEHRIRLTEFMFEKYSIPAMFICKSAVLSAFSCGRSTCLVFDSGHSNTFAVPVNDGYALQKPILRTDIGGSFVTNELGKLIEGVKGVPIVPHYKFNKNKVEDQYVTEYFSNIRDDPTYEQFWKKEIVRDVKETALAISEDPISVNNAPMNTGSAQSIYELPDGRTVDLNEERYSITEKLFQANKEIGFVGYPQMILDAISRSDIEIRKDLFANIFVCGGNTLFSGFPERLQKQLFSTSAQTTKIKVITHPSPTERKFSTWIGGSILSSLGTFHQLWLSKQEFDEHGATIIERKCA